ncbi:MAG: putative TPR repeat methyltransferase [Hyphomicrobiaceae bacterium]|jgi:predicted TPR repeat methyltransferase
MAKELEGFVARLTALGGGSGDSHDVYEDWAPTYEQNLQQDYGYIAPELAADVLSRYCPDKNIRILDLGCGTGLVGVELFKRGFNRFDGLDVSQGMLDVARSKQIYGDLIVADMTQLIDLSGRSYDAAIAVGCFGGGHLGPQHLAGIIKCVTAGGILLFYINGIPYDEDDYPKHFASLEAAGVCHVLAQEHSNYMQSVNRPGWAVVLSRAE